MTPLRRVWYAILIFLAKRIARFMWATCRVDKVIGEEHFEQMLDEGQPVIPVYWHQMHLFCSHYLLAHAERGLKLGFLISPSLSGEVPNAIALQWGATVFRGSPSRTGGQALKDLYQAICRDGISPVVTVDGPKGPVNEFKPGPILLARVTKAPLLPMAYAADKSRFLNTWDRFILPRPFTRIVIAIGEPVRVTTSTPLEELEPIRERMEEKLKSLTAEAQAALRVET